MGFTVASAGRKASDAMRTGRTLRAIPVLVLLLAAVFGVADATQAAAQNVPQTDDPAQAAAGWLARQLVDGDHFEAEFGGERFPDQGLTADAVIAFDAADVSQSFATQATAWLARPDIMSGYLGDGTAESYAGPHAKLALVAIAQGLDPAAFGGVDLIAGLHSRLMPSGRFSDLSAFGDFSNAITQSLAVITMVRAGSDADAQAGAGYLASAQCDDGGFPLDFEEATCASEPDATGFAVQALLAAGLDAGAALDYLQGVQRDDGGFGGAGPTEPTNANSTAVAAQALRSGDRDAAADAAVGYLTRLQVGCAGPAEQHGAVAYDASGFEVSTAVRATAQAVTALSGTGLLDVDNTGDAAPAPALACAPPTTVSPEPTSPPSPSSPSPAPQPGTGPELPATGAPVVPSLLTGALLILTGLALVLTARRRALREETGR